MKALNDCLTELISRLDDNTEIRSILADKNIHPFTREGHILAYLIDAGIISYDDYRVIYRQYTERNKYLELFDLAPRTFGETWGENHIRSLFPEFRKASTRELAGIIPEFDGEFDLWHDDGIRIEVKACRANRTSSKESLTSRAYLHAEAKQAQFKYHYQQLKPSCYDVFIWIGVCRDDLIYWVLTSKELISTGKLGPQHRNVNTGNRDAEVYEGQVFMTEEELSPYMVREADVLSEVREKFRLSRIGR
ncbi:MAG TPA: hypothetical protein H9879_02165 [Candidatus Alistipes intestinipullorum]|nr:hypothetical protein [Candidatus Alistipes intestinipullorum]